MPVLEVRAVVSVLTYQPAEFAQRPTDHKYRRGEHTMVDRLQKNDAANNTGAAVKNAEGYPPIVWLAANRAFLATLPLVRLRY